MTSNNWSELLQTLSELHDVAPDYRLGQLICNLAMHVDEPDTVAVWDVEDEDLLSAAREFLKTLRERSSSSPAAH